MSQDITKIETWDSVWDWEIYDMITPNYYDQSSEIYGEIRLKIPRPFNRYGKVSTFDFDWEWQYRGKRWMFSMTALMNPEGPWTLDG